MAALQGEAGHPSERRARPGAEMEAGMVLGRYLAGAVALGALAAGGCTLPSELATGTSTSHAAGAGAPLGAKPGRKSVVRWAMTPSATGVQLIATGSDVGDVLAAEVSSRHTRAARPKTGSGRLPHRAHQGPGASTPTPPGARSPAFRARPPVRSKGHGRERSHRRGPHRRRHHRR